MTISSSLGSPAEAFCGFEPNWMSRGKEACGSILLHRWRRWCTEQERGRVPLESQTEEVQYITSPPAALLVHQQWKWIEP